MNPEFYKEKENKILKNEEKERIINLSMKYCTAFLGGMAVNTSVLSKVLDELFTNK